MRKLLDLSIAFCVASVAFSAASFADVRDFTVVNDAHATIVAMWLSTYNDNRWHVVRGFHSLEPGQQTDIRFDNPGPCRVQLRIELDDGSTPEWRAGFDFCTISKIRIWYDSSEDTYHAQYE